MARFLLGRRPNTGTEKMPPNRNESPLMKPLAALATPGMYLFYRYNQYKRQQAEQHRRKVTERELENLNHKIDRLLSKIEDNDSQLAPTEDDECVICLQAQATMQTLPCGHTVVCRKCFIKTIQMAVAQRCLPLRCVFCRTKILKLRQITTPATTYHPTATSSISRHQISTNGKSGKALSGVHVFKKYSRVKQTATPPPRQAFLLSK